MKLDVRGLEISGQGGEKALSFDRPLDLSSLIWWGEHPYPSPVRVWGRVVNRGNFYELHYNTEHTRAFVCARCARPVDRPEAMAFTHTVMEAGEDSPEQDDVIVIRGGILDLGRLVADDLLLELGEPELCDPDCPGLCPVCGGRMGECDHIAEPPAKPRTIGDLLRKDRE